MYRVAGNGFGNYVHSIMLDHCMLRCHFSIHKIPRGGFVFGLDVCLFLEADLLSMWNGYQCYQSYCF